MTKEIINVSNIIPKEDMFLKRWAEKNPDKLAIFLRAYSTGKVTKTHAAAAAGFSIKTLQRVNKLAQEMLAYCEDQNINYEDTDCFFLINCFLQIEKARTTASGKLVDIIHKQAEEGNFNAAKFLLSKVDPEWAEASNSHQVNVNVDKKGVSIELVDFTNVIDGAADAQDYLMNLTREK